MNYETTIEAGLFEEFEAKIEFDYQPKEEQVLYPVEDAYPGCAEAANITSVEIFVGGAWVETLSSLSTFAIDELETECLENL